MATAATRPGEPVAATSPFKRLARERRLLIAVAVFLVLLSTVASIGSARLTYYDLSQLAASGAPLALAAIGQTIVILSGGFDLSAGAAISLVNVALASSLQDPVAVAAGGRRRGRRDRDGRGRLQRILRRRPAHAADCRHARDDVHSAGCDPADHGQARRTGFAGAGRPPAWRRRSKHPAQAGLADRPGSGGVGVAQADQFRRRDLRRRRRRRFGARGRGAHALRAIHGLRRRRRLLRSGRRLHQRGDRVGRSADRQPHAAPDVRGRRRRRDEARRRAGRPPRHGIWRLHPDDGGQHPPGPQRVGVLLDDRRGLDPHSRRARRRSAAGLSARPPHPPCRPQDEGARARPPCLPTLGRGPIPEPARARKADAENARQPCPAF